MDWLSWELTGTVPRWYVYLFNYLVAPAPVAYGSSQARGCIRAAAAQPVPQPQCQILGAYMTYTEACGNAGSLSH